MTRTTPKVPWHFWLLVGALVIYLGWRLIEVIIWCSPATGPDLPHDVTGHSRHPGIEFGAAGRAD